MAQDWDAIAPIVKLILESGADFMPDKLEYHPGGYVIFKWATIDGEYLRYMQFDIDTKKLAFTKFLRLSVDANETEICYNIRMFSS